MAVFDDFGLDEFWEESDFARRQYQENPPTDEQIARVERELGYKLPLAYVELMCLRNGGIPIRNCHRTQEPTVWASDHVAIHGIFAIGIDANYSLGGNRGSKFWVEEWKYPLIGVYFADCPSAGHDMLCLDYRSCGPKGEPQVVHVAQEREYKVTLVAPNFESFIRGLEASESFDDEVYDD